MTTKEKTGKTRPKTAPRRPASAAPRQTNQPPRQAKPRSAEVVYTQPKPFNRGRFLLRLLTVIAVVGALVFGMAIFFKVQVIEVAGTEKYTPWEVREASGIQEGDNLLTLSRSRISSRIIDKLPYIARVNGIRILLPDTVVIDVTELDVVYAVEDGDGGWWLVDAAGDVVEQLTGTDADAYTKLEGVRLDRPAVGKKAMALEEAPEETTEEGETIPVTVYASERLDVLLSISQYLEDNGILGEIVSVDVSDLGNIELWYGQRYQIFLGDTSRLGYKIGTLKAVLDQESDHQRGILDLSFTIKENEVVYTPFP